ncbi:MAG: hypothetical protein A2Z72_00325 [Omnitrophica bacterium RBG_13_46_9]|nr:MAG: hypothetical protein A2Z72_00325 [Omnitrophica bacterium RBG_13_46_9]
MTKKIRCIECPKGCVLSVDTEDKKVMRVRDSKCPKGEKYAVSEVENPVRTLTSAVPASGLPLKMIPVRTDRPIPKPDMKRAMEEIKRLRVYQPVQAGAVIAENFIGLGVNLIATRDCHEEP